MVEARRLPSRRGKSKVLSELTSGRMGTTKDKNYMDVTHGPRAISLNSSLLTERWSDNKPKAIAQMIYQTADRLLCIDAKGGFQSSKLPGDRKRNA